MSKLTKAWVEAQIERELDRGNHPDAVRDLAALVNVRSFLLGEMAESLVEHNAEMKHHGNAHAVATHEAEETISHHLTLPTVTGWVDEMEDAEGVKGGKYTWHQAQQYAMNKGITGQQRQLEFYWAMNAMYADYHEAGKKFGVDKPEFYACLAKLFIEDPDAVEDKVEKYVKHIVKKG